MFWMLHFPAKTTQSDGRSYAVRLDAKLPLVKLGCCAPLSGRPPPGGIDIGSGCRRSAAQGGELTILATLLVKPIKIPKP